MKYSYNQPGQKNDEKIWVFTLLIENSNGKKSTFCDLNQMPICCAKNIKVTKDGY